MKVHLRLRPASGNFLQCCLGNRSTVGLTGNEPVSSFQDRSSTAGSPPPPHLPPLLKKNQTTHLMRLKTFTSLISLGFSFFCMKCHKIQISTIHNIKLGDKSRHINVQYDIVTSILSQNELTEICHLGRPKKKNRF